MVELGNWPKGNNGEFKCTKENPMPLEMSNQGKWSHDDVEETDYDNDYRIEWRCNSCGYTWMTEMPD